MSTKLIELTFDEWLETYKPITNHIDTNASFQDESGNGIMFETYGEEVEFVKSMNPNKIWMYGSGDDGGTYIWSGWGFVNRLGYFITEVPFSDSEIVQVLVADPDLTCDLCDEIIDTDQEHQCEEIE
jgi:hypothetical protein